MGVGRKNRFLSPLLGLGDGVVGAGALGEGGATEGARGAPDSCVGMNIPSSATARPPACAAPSSAVKTTRTMASAVLQSPPSGHPPLARASHGPMIGFFIWSM